MQTGGPGHYMQWSPEVGVSRESLQHREPDGELSAATVRAQSASQRTVTDWHRSAKGLLPMCWGDNGCSVGAPGAKY
jgi:hypothetical protein